MMGTTHGSGEISQLEHAGFCTVNNNELLRQVITTVFIGFLGILGRLLFNSKLWPLAFYIYSRISIFRASEGNENWFKISGKITVFEGGKQQHS